MTNTADMFEFNNFVKFTSKFFSDWKLETGNKDDIFLTTFVGVLLLLRKKDLLVDVEKKCVTIANTQREIVISKFIGKVLGNVIIVNSQEPRGSVFVHELQTLVLDMLNVYSSFTGKDDEDLPCVKKYVSSLQDLDDDFTFNKAFDHLLKILGEQHFKDGFIYVPNELSKFSMEFVDIDESERMYNPCAGIGTYALQLPESFEYLGEEENINLWRLGMINLAINELTNVKFRCVNPYKTTSRIHSIGAYSVASIPPFLYNSFIDYTSIFDRSVHKHELVNNFEVCLYNNIFANCEHKSFCIVPASILDNQNALYEDLRITNTGSEDEIFINNIILLPENIFPGTNIQTAIISTYGIELGNNVRMTDLSHCYQKGLNGKNVFDYELAKKILNDDSSEHSVYIDYEGLAKHNHSWNPHTYLHDKSESSSDNTTQLKYILEVFPKNTDFDEKEGRLVTYDDLVKSEFEESTMSIEEVPVRELPENAYKLTFPTMLLSLKNSLRPTFCMASEELPVFVSPDIISFFYKADVLDVNYFLHYLWSIDPKKYFRGVIDPYITLMDLGELEISIIPMEQQKAIACEWARMQDKRAVEEVGLASLVDEMKTEYMDEIRMRKHDMKPYVSELLNAHELLTYYVNEGGDDIGIKADMNTLLSRMQASLASLATALDRLNEEETFGTPVTINLEEYLAELAKQFENERYSVNIQIDNVMLIEDGVKQKALVSIAKEDLDNLCHNIINNAIAHGFTDSERVDYEVNIRLSVDSKDRMFVIDFCNNGTPFPDGLTKERYGLKGEKAGSTGHTGIGGHRVKSITRHYKGDYDLFYNADSNFPNVIRVYLPIK